MRNNLSNVKDFFASRRSERVYSDAPLTEQEIQMLIFAGKSGPVSGGLDCVYVQPLTTCEEKMLFRKACFYQDFVTSSSCIFLVGCKENLLQKHYPPEYIHMLSCENASVSAENIIIASHLMGVAACFIGVIRENIITPCLHDGEAKIWCAVCVGNRVSDCLE